MKKTLLTLSVLLTVVCCTLAYASTKQGTLALFDNASAPKDEPQSVEKPENTTVNNSFAPGLQIDQESINLATSCVPSASTKKITKAEGQNQGDVEVIVVDLWNNATEIYPVNSGMFDIATNTLSFAGSAERTYQIFTDINDDNQYGWNVVGGKTYHFSGTLNADGNATIYPCIAYKDFSGNGWYIANSETIILNEENEFSSDFDVVASGIEQGYALSVAFFIEDSSTETTIASKNNQFYYSYKTLVAQEWTSENNLPGLGLDNIDGGKYIVTCEDGETTLGLYCSGNDLFVTGINTTVSEVALPENITIGENELHINGLGRWDQDIELSAAPNLTTLDATYVEQIYTSFTGSAITDLYIGYNTSFYYGYSGFGNIYLHIPYGASRSRYTSYGFKRVLVGDEQSYYPVTYYSDWVIAGENEGDYFGISRYNGYYCISEIFTDKEEIELPFATPATGGMYYIRYFGDYDNRYDDYLCRNANNLKSVVIPSSYTYLYVYWDENYCPITDLHMQGDAPNTVQNLPSYMTVYVANQLYFANYLNNTAWNNAVIMPEGWDFEWITVDVQKKGEFAETYLTQNDYDWSAGKYVKVTGNINDVDLNAIKNLTSLYKLDLSETTIESLPERFMYYKNTLLEVMLPTTLKNIGQYAFYGCSSLQSFNLQGITTIDNYVFYGCSSLPYINLAGVQTIGNYAFQYCTKLSGIDLSTVVSIGDNAFRNCTSLDAIDLSSVVAIGSTYSNYNYNESYSFAGCVSLKKVTFGDHLKNLGRFCFANTAIDSIVLHQGLTIIPESAFQNCKDLVSVELPSTIAEIDNYAFSGCASLSSVKMESGLTTIREKAFYGCTSLEEVSIPATVKTIGQDAFNKTNIKNFKCYAAVPPTATASFIGNEMDMSRTFLYVPPFSKDFYRNTQYWSDFFLMRSVDEQIEYILVDRQLTINLEEEDNEVVANNPEIVLSRGLSYDQWGEINGYTIGQLTATGDGTLSAGQMNIDVQLARRSSNSYQYCPTLINYAEKMRADNVTVNMALYNYNYSSGEWHFISLPFDVKVSDIIPSNNTYWVIRRYDSVARAAGETSVTWINLTNDDIMEAGKGYIVSAVSGDAYTYPRLSFTSGNSLTKNNIFRPTDIIVPLEEYTSEFAHNRSWNLIGNPYPCYFDMHYLNEEFTAPVTVWNGSAYVAYSPVDDDLVLSPYEAFFVQCPLDATEMTFKEAGRLHSDQGKSLYKAPAMSEAAVSAEGRNVFNFEVSGENSSDRARIVLNADAAMDYEVGRDAAKFFADNSDIAQIYVSGDVNYSISERPVGDGVATLGLRTSVEGAYTLSLSGRYSSEWHVFVTDNVTGITVDLTETDYQFAVGDGDQSTRFSVMFQLGSQSGIESVIVDFGADAHVTVTALNGTVVYTGRASEATVPSAGIYVIADGTKTRKAILK